MFLEELFESESITEKSRLVFRKRGNHLSRHFRCPSGKIVQSPSSCPSMRQAIRPKNNKLTHNRFKFFNKRGYFDKLKSKRRVKHLLDGLSND